MNQDMISDDLGESRLYRIGVVLVMLALGISLYLSYTKLADVEVACTESETINCNTVQDSRYGELMGIPLAYLGLATNLLLLALHIGEKAYGERQQEILMLIFGLVLVAFLYSLFLVYVQAADLKAYCLWCLAHEALITGLFGVTLVRVRRQLWGG